MSKRKPKGYLTSNVLACTAHELYPRVPRARLQFFQGSLKSITPEEREKLKANLLAHGFFDPVFTWEDGADLWIIDGHNRLMICDAEGWEVEGGVPIAPIVAADDLGRSGRARPRRRAGRRPGLLPAGLRDRARGRLAGKGRGVRRQ